MGPITPVWIHDLHLLCEKVRTAEKRFKQQPRKKPMSLAKKKPVTKSAKKTTSKPAPKTVKRVTKKEVDTWAFGDV